MGWGAYMSWVKRLIRQVLPTPLFPCAPVPVIINFHLRELAPTLIGYSIPDFRAPHSVRVGMCVRVWYECLWRPCRCGQ